MMGRTHALTGWCAGLVVAPLTGVDSIAQAVVFASTTAGFALLPDLDHPGARASKLLGPLTAAGTAAGGPWAVAGVVLLGLLLAEDALGDWLLPVGGAAVIWWVYEAGPDPLAQLDAVSGYLGIAVAAGCITHCLGDALTESGCPFLFPVPIAGETWYEIRPPSWLRFRTGKGVENAVIFPVFTVLAFVLFPGAWELGVEVVDRVFGDPGVATAEP